jgi:hypothetical protein
MLRITFFYITIVFFPTLCFGERSQFCEYLFSTLPESEPLARLKNAAGVVDNIDQKLERQKRSIEAAESRIEGMWNRMNNSERYYFGLGGGDPQLIQAHRLAMMMLSARRSRHARNLQDRERLVGEYDRAISSAVGHLAIQPGVLQGTLKLKIAVTEALKRAAKVDTAYNKWQEALREIRSDLARRSRLNGKAHEMLEYEDSLRMKYRKAKLKYDEALGEVVKAIQESHPSERALFICDYLASNTGIEDDTRSFADVEDTEPVLNSISMSR